MLAVTAYNAYLVVHVVAAIAWLGGGLVLSLLGARIARAGDAKQMVAFSRDAEWVGNRVFMPAGLLVLLFGFLMIHEGPWAYDQLWIGLGLGLFAVTFLTGALFLGPRSGKLAKLVEQEGAESREVASLIRQLLFVSRLDLLTLYSVAVVMVAKPTTDDALLFAIWGAVLAALAALVVRAHLRQSRALPETAPVLTE